MFLTISICYDQLPLESSLTLHENAGYYIIRNQNNSVQVRLRKRIDYPTTFCHRLPNGSIRLGYGTETSDEFLRIDLTPQGNITVERDAIGTLPVFYASSHDRLFLSNNYEFVVRNVAQTTVDDSFFVEHVMPTTYRQEATLLREVRILEPLGRLQQSADQSSISYTSLPKANIAVANPSEFLLSLDSQLERFIMTRLRDQQIGFEVSGGLDSATLPAYMSQATRYQAPLFTIFFPTPSQTDQAMKLTDLQEFTGYHLEQVNADVSADCFDISYLPHTPEELNTAIYFVPLIKLMQSRGVRIVCTGTGGDDVFENITAPETHYMYGESERQRRQQQPLAPYVTDVFRSAYAAAVPSNPSLASTILPLSVLGETMFLHNLYIEHDIWPVSPFVDPDWYAYCQRLPAHFKANKNLLRMYHQARNFPNRIYNSLKYEDFAGYFATLVCTPKTRLHIESLLPRAETVRRGYVDTAKLLNTFDACMQGDTTWLYHIFYLLGTELSLQSTPNLLLSSGA